MLVRSLQAVQKLCENNNTTERLTRHYVYANNIFDSLQSNSTTKHITLKYAVIAC